MAHEPHVSNGDSPRPVPHRRPVARAEALSIANLRSLLALMQNSDVEEITVETQAGDMRLSLRKPAPSAAAPESAHHSVAHDASDPDVDGGSPPGSPPELVVTAPLVGRFYLGHRSGAKPLVAVGDIVRPGQIVGSIETLNVYNEVESDHAGRVARIDVGEGQPVEYGQPLITLEPLAS